jgi:tungstate transport system substrate-binding protein
VLFVPRLTMFLILAAALLAPATAQASDVIVQGTTDVRDAGLLEDRIIPEFQAAYPQYTLKYVAVGTGQALTNARAGQGDAVLTHAPTLEAKFVSDGYSAEPLGRAIFYSDYVILGPPGDPAGVMTGARNDAAHAFELIAAAGAAGRANFVSRGDNSGTNVQERLIWGLTQGVARNENNEPTNAPWYHKAGLGQADTVRLADQCPFTGGGCYEMTDRGTFNRLKANGAITQLQVVADRNAASARGGDVLLVNPFHAYIVNPAKNPKVNVDGARAFLDFLTSEKFQAELKNYPNAQDPAFFADARPDFGVRFPKSLSLPARIDAGRRIKITGILKNLVPGAPPLQKVPMFLQRATGPDAFAEVARDDTSLGGVYSMTFAPTRTGALRLFFPGFLDLQSASLSVGSVRVRAVVVLRRARLTGNVLRITGIARPDRDRAKPALLVEGRKKGSGSFRMLARKAIGTRGSSFAITTKLTSGPWQLRVRYRDPGTVDDGVSRSLRLSVP